MEARSILLERLRTDLIGPSGGAEELIEDRPSDRYLTGILFPQNLEVGAQEDENIEEIQSGKVANLDSSKGSNVAASRTTRPASAGISLAVFDDESSPPKIIVDVSAGIYALEEDDSSGEPKRTSDNKADDAKSLSERRSEKPREDGGPKDAATNGSRGSRQRWRRSPCKCSRVVTLDQVLQEIPLGEECATGVGVIAGMGLFVRSMRIGDKIAVTVQAINRYQHDNQATRNEIEERTFFQFEMRVKPVTPTKMAPRPIADPGTDEDSRTSSLIYRKAVEYATGHTCSAEWSYGDSNQVVQVNTAWIPDLLVKSVDPEGDEVFKGIWAQQGLRPPTAKGLSTADPSTLERTLICLTNAYENWLRSEADKIADLPSDSLKEQARIHLERCREALERMRDGVSLISSDDKVRRAFQTANAAMELQASWGRKTSTENSEGKPTELTWRPFQLGFALLCLRSFQDPTHEDRRTLDLIWFPTGGGKTEAYLLVAAFLLFYRRLVQLDKQESYGTAILMRYTLRTLTIQQFQRAAALICACETIRRGDHNFDGKLGRAVFSIGLWVGQGSTPNNSKTAIETLHSNVESTPKQIEICPACDTDLLWEVSKDHKSVLCRCGYEQCPLSQWKELPISTVDDLIYQDPPSMVIGTVDKFAQLVRRDEVSVLFGRNTPSKPPDLIIQDELHLISGPLGTLTGIYETAIDHLCTEHEIGPKIIGSTATIRRARQQVHALFKRTAFQFPPPVIDEENSGFARIDEDSVGRLYVGVTTAGRTDKYMLQAVCASLLQAVSDKRIPEEARDPYGTLVAYFNSLRILGGALVAMQDDVPKSINAISQRRNEDPRYLTEPEEMTSRKASSEIPKVLRQLGIPFGKPGSIDTLLASNMLSVGVDIPRLGLMVVSGQPKTMSEYIQATSRVGRQMIPGLIVTIYNNSKVRDRAHYETFRTWHSSLYRSVEATSVTPFAPRARDKALHAALVGLARHGLKEFDDPTLTEKKRRQLEKEIVPLILSRVAAVDPRESEATQSQLVQLMDHWSERGKLQYYWWDWKDKQSLLISAEKAAARKASGYAEDTMAWETPNSMRNVEPGVDFQLWESAKLNRNSE